MPCASKNYGWFAAGTIIGTAIALLFAPRSGQETREFITKKAEEGKDAFNSSSKDLIEKGQDLYERGRALAEEAADLFERGRSIVRG